MRLRESSKLLSRQTQNHSPGGGTSNTSNSLLINTDNSVIEGSIETALSGRFFNTAEFFRPDLIIDDDDDSGENTEPLVSQPVDGSPSLLSHYQVTTEWFFVADL